MLKIGNKLKKLRLEKGYSQEYLAHAIDMSQGNYCKLESDNHVPSLEALEKLATLYEITLQDLLAVEGQTQIQYNQNHDNSSSAFVVWHDSHKLVEDLLSSKEKIIALQAKQIEMLESQLKSK